MPFNSAQIFSTQRSSSCAEVEPDCVYAKDESHTVQEAVNTVVAAGNLECNVHCNYDSTLKSQNISLRFAYQPLLADEAGAVALAEIFLT